MLAAAFLLRDVGSEGGQFRSENVRAELYNSTNINRRPERPPVDILEALRLSRFSAICREGVLL